MMTSDSRELKENRGIVSGKLLERGIQSFSKLITYLKKMPYGRVAYGDDLSKIIDEGKGTCSTKHALIRTVAIEQNWIDLRLFLYVYKMSEQNTPGIGQAIKPPLSYIPEAHCIIKDGDEVIDVTTEDSDFQRIEADVLQLREIEPHQIGDWKVAYHKEYLRNWLSDGKKEISMEEIWQIREECIANLSNLLD